MDDLRFRLAQLAVAAALLGCLLAAPAGAVVGGTPANPKDYPWYTSIGNCGGSLVAPDRILTAGHCVGGRPLEAFGAASFGGQFYNPIGFAMHPGWRRSNGENVFDDVALVILDRPVEGVTPASLDGAFEPAMTIIGQGRRFAPGSAHSEAENFDTHLRQAKLRPITDSGCARLYRHRKGNGGEHFEAETMFCATDIDGRAPLSSGCNGDGGGPFFAGTPAAPVVLGVVSWGGSRCGADHLPSVFAEVGRFRDFITGPAPVLAPTALSGTIVSGTPRVGRWLSCRTTGYTSRPTRVRYTWQRSGGGRVKNVGHAKTYKLRKADAGHVLVCSIAASNDGGFSDVPFGTRSGVRVPRTQAAAATAATSSLVTRPHATKPLSDARAARLVHRSSFEPRPVNQAATHRTPSAAELAAFRAKSDMPYARYVTGHFTGTTDEVIQWAARKWGLTPDLLRAVATQESWWRMSTVGDNGDSFGLFQVRRPFHCTEPVCEQFRSDAALNADYYGGILRSYYDGKQTWLNTVSGENGKRYKRGDLWASVGAWFSGRWWNAGARSYVRAVKRHLARRTWRTPDFRG